MRGTPKEEISKGCLDKYEALELIHEQLKPNKYLEIGIRTGKSLILSKCDSVGIDPNPILKFNTDATIFKMTSDQYFKENHNQLFQPDLVFIDGMHLFENVLKDFINVEKSSHKDTVILIDDIFPAHPAQALRKQRTNKWCGDVWKIVFILITYRPDLHLFYLDTSPTGILLIKNINPKDSILLEQYDLILTDFRVEDIPPNSIIHRHFVIEKPQDIIFKEL